MITVHGLDAEYICDSSEIIQINSGDINIHLTPPDATNLIDALSHLFFSCFEVIIGQGNYAYKKISSEDKKDSINITYNLDRTKSINLNYNNFIQCLGTIVELLELNNIKNKTMSIEVSNNNIY